MLTREAAHPDVTSVGTWGSKFPTVLILLSGVEVVVEVLVPRPLSMRPPVGF